MGGERQKSVFSSGPVVPHRAFSFCSADVGKALALVEHRHMPKVKSRHRFRRTLIIIAAVEAHCGWNFISFKYRHFRPSVSRCCAVHP